MTREYLRGYILKRLAVQYDYWADVFQKEFGVLKAENIGVQDWRNERERLMNTPDWDDAPDDALYLTLDSYGDYYWHNKKPELAGAGWCPGAGGEGTYAGSVLAVIKGMPWKCYSKCPVTLNFGEDYRSR